MSNVQEPHGRHITSRLELNSELPEKDSFTEEINLEPGDQSLPTTSGIMTMVLNLFVKILDMVRVKEPEPEIHITENTSIPKLHTEDVLIIIDISCTAESMVDQTIMTELLTLMSNAQVNHGYHTT
jgi:hypothetical protein